MNLRKPIRIISSLAAGGLLLLGLTLLLDQTHHIVRADPGLFVEPGGSGSTCTQAQPCTLQTALAQAIAGETIYLATGTYTGTGPAVVTITKSITLYGGWDGTTTAPTVRDPTLFPSILDGQDQRRVVDISGDIAPTLDGLIITRGSETDSGGGIKVESASPVIRNNQILLNSTNRDGGAIFVNHGAAQILNNRIISNSATWAGGLRIVNDADVIILGNEIRGNVATISGGGIDLGCCGGVTPLIEQNLIIDNDGGNAGGGVRIHTAHAELVNNILAHNRAAEGAGIYLKGMDSFPVQAALANNTLVGHADGDQAVWVEEYVNLTLVNNILTNYATGITNTAPLSSSISADHNLFWNASDPIIGTNAVLDDPLLDVTYHLEAASPARDAGIAVDLTKDFDGDPRPIGAGYDIGADELGMKIFLPLVTKNVQ